jgi:hypothetical protein
MGKNGDRDRPARRYRRPADGFMVHDAIKNHFIFLNDSVAHRIGFRLTASRFETPFTLPSLGFHNNSQWPCEN